MDTHKINIILFAIPLFTLSVMLEATYNYYKRYDYYDTKDAIASLTMGIGNAILRQWTPWIFLPVYFYLYDHSYHYLFSIYYQIIY